MHSYALPPVSWYSLSGVAGYSTASELGDERVAHACTGQIEPVYARVVSEHHRQI